jgi:hypothetical protein
MRVHVDAAERRRGADLANGPYRKPIRKEKITALLRTRRSKELRINVPSSGLTLNVLSHRNSDTRLIVTIFSRFGAGMSSDLISQCENFLLAFEQSTMVSSRMILNCAREM